MLHVDFYAAVWLLQDALINPKKNKHRGHQGGDRISVSLVTGRCSLRYWRYSIVIKNMSLIKLKPRPERNPQP